MASGSDERKSDGVSGPGAGSSRRRLSSEAVERALTEVSQTLERLKQVRAERAEAEARFKAELEARDEKLASAESALAAAEAARAEAEARIEGAQQAAAGEIERLEAELAEAERRAEEARGSAIQAAEDHAATVARLGEERDEAARGAAELAEQLEAAEQDLALQRETNSTFASRLEEAEGLRAQIEQLRGEVEASRARVQELENSGDSALAEAHARAEALSGELEQARQESETRASEVAGLVARAEEAELALEIAGEEAAENARVLEGTIEQRQAEIDRLTAEHAEARAACEELAAGRDELSKRLAAAEASGGDAEQRLRAECEELRASLEGERAGMAEMESKLDLAADRIGELQAALEERGEASAEDGQLRETISGLTAELADVRARCEAAEGERDQLRARIDAGGGSAVGGADEARLALRRQRLRRARGLIREHAVKADQLEALLEQREAQCEDVLSRRRELVQAREVIERAHKRLHSARGRSGAAATIFFGLGTIAVLAGLSWSVVLRSFPGRYAASGVVAAQFEGVEPTAEALESWQEFHEKLLFDPQMMSVAAERLEQRGFEEYAQPAALKVMLEQELTWAAPEPGKMTFELRGLGQESTARVLESYLTSLIAQSSALRQRRSETSTTVIAEDVRAGTEPLDHRQLEYAGIGAGSGALVCLLLWFGIWKRMVKTKSAFEDSTAVDHLLEDARWIDPIQKIIESPGEGSGSKAA